MRPGSLSVQTRKWGGQYHQLSYTHLGKGRTEYISQEHVKDIKRQIANYRKFRDLAHEWANLAIESCKLRASQDDET